MKSKEELDKNIASIGDLLSIPKGVKQVMKLTEKKRGFSIRS